MSKSKITKGLLLLVSFAVIFSLLLVPSVSQAEERTVIDIRTAPLGSFDYTVGIIMEDLSKNHPWLRVSVIEGRGGAWCIRYLIDHPEARKNTIFAGAPFTRYQALEGIGAFEGKPMPIAKDMRGFMSHSVMSGYFLALNPNIKTVYDLEGKRVALGRKGQNSWAILPDLMLKALGIKAKIEFLGPSKAVGALLEKKVDACIDILLSDISGRKTNHSAGYLKAVGFRGKDLHPVGWKDEATAKKAIQTVLPWGKSVKIAANSCANQPEPMWVGSRSVGFSCWKTLPDKIAHELVMMMGASLEKYEDRHAMVKCCTLETRATGWLKEFYHPAAVKAYEELGVRYSE